MRKRTGRLLAFGLALCLLLVFGTAAADGMHTEVVNDTLDMEVRLGYDGKITYGKPVPVRVTVRNRGEDLEGILAVNGYASAEYYDRFETEISVPAGSERTVVLAVTAGIRQDVFTAEILKAGKVICAVNASPESLINPAAMMVGVLSTRPRNLSNLDISQENDTLNRYEYWQTVPLAPETIPDDPELLDAFGMIVLDDTDPAQLTEKQQAALKGWVRRGHVLLCGGGTAAPGNLAFLGDLVTLQADGFTVSGGVHDALESFAGRKATARRPEITLAQITGGTPMVSDEAGNGLVWRIQAGSGRIYVLAWEAGDPALNAESLMHVFYQQMLVKADMSLYNNILYRQEGSGAVYSPGESSRIGIRNTLPLAAAVIAAAALAGLALWIVLNRHGKSKWMWAGLPLVSLAAAAAIAIMAGSSMLNGPAAAVAVNIVQDETGERTYYTGVTAAAPKAGVHRYSIPGEKLEVLSWNEPYWADEDEENQNREPAELRIIRKTGEMNEAAFNAESPWQATEMSAVRTGRESGNVEAEIWMEEDGLHGTISNGTELSLKEGAVLCIWGFARIPALAPGESADFLMAAESAADPNNPVFTDGKMLQNASAGLYSVVSQMFFGAGNEYDYESRNGILAGMINSASNELARRHGDPYGSGSDGTVFMYCAEPEEVAVPAIFADGKEVESKSAIPMLTAEMAYKTVGKTGVVFHAPGMDKAIRCSLDEEGLPAGDMEEEQGYSKYGSYHSLSETPTFRFTPEDTQDIEISKLVIGLEQWYLNETKGYVLNVKYRKWEEIQLNTPLTRPEKYIDEKGNLYCQFRSATGEYYSEIPAPTLTLEGRVKHASSR